jgi:hypothetical protein
MTRWETKVLASGLLLALVVPPVVAQPQSGGTGRRPAGRSDLRQDVFFSGRVIMEDGTPPPEPVVVEIVCGSSRTQQTLTDAKGKFGFRFGERPGIGDVSTSGSDQDTYGRPRNVPQPTVSTPLSRTPVGASQNPLLGCDLHVALSGYRADDVPLSQHRAMDSPDIGTIILHRVAGVTGTMISINSLNAPKKAKKLYAEGGEAAKKGNWQKAEKHFAKAVEIYPAYAAAWYRLGAACVQQQKIPEAQAAFHKAMEAEPDFVLPYLGSAQLALQQKRWNDVLGYTRKIISLDPMDYPQAYLMQAVAQGGIGLFDDAEGSIREAIRIDKYHHFPRTEYILGIVLANKKDYAGAIQHMRIYVSHVPRPVDADAVNLQIARMEHDSTMAATAQPAPK